VAFAADLKNSFSARIDARQYVMLIFTCEHEDKHQPVTGSPSGGAPVSRKGLVHMTSNCTFCSLNEQATTASRDHGYGSTEHRSALAELAPLFALARYSNQHSAECLTMLPIASFA
jgi:hypothetical protein